MSSGPFLQTRDAALNELSPYGYVPTKTVCIIFLVLFSLSTSLHVGQAWRYRTWFLLPTIALGGIAEILGWSGRLWSSTNAVKDTPFMIQISTTIMGPTPILAANFIILGRIIQRLGIPYCRLRPKVYTMIFLSFDIVSLVVQGAGGGIASSATTLAGANIGGNVMLGGIVFQLVIIVLYMSLATEFFTRYFYDKPFRRNLVPTTSDNSVPRGTFETRLKVLTGALVFNTLCLFIRAIYRTIELSDGWDGRIIKTQLYFNILDGMMVVLAMYTFNLMHPGILLKADYLAKGAAKEVDMDSRSTSHTV